MNMAKGDGTTLFRKSQVGYIIISSNLYLIRQLYNCWHSERSTGPGPLEFSIATGSHARGDCELKTIR